MKKDNTGEIHCDNGHASKNMILVQWLIFIMLSFFSLYSPETNDIKNVHGLAVVVFCLAFFNIILNFKPSFFLRHSFGVNLLFISDVVFISLVVYFTRGWDSDLYLSYFLIIFIAALSQSIARSIIVTTVISVVYGALIFKDMGFVNFLKSSLLIRIPFFYVVALFTSFLVEQIMHQKKSVYNLQKNKEDELVSEKEKLSVTLRSIGEGVIAVDKQKKITLINKAAEGITGYSDKEALNKRIEDVFCLLDEKTKEPVELLFGRLEKCEKELLSFNAVLKTKTGEERIISKVCSSLKDKNSNIIGAVLTFRDITEEKKLEEELLKVSKHESIALLAGGIAHDFNNILTSILGNISFAKMSLDPESETFKDLSDAEKATMQATHLTQQLLTFSKGGAPVKKVISLGKIIRDTVNFTLRGTSVKSRFDIDDKLWMIEADEGQINEVINNLVINAKDSMSEGGEIEIKAENIAMDSEQYSTLPGGKYIRISIQDQGVGISKELLNKIFDPYFTTKKKGSGLGLAVCYSIIKKHGGHIAVDSEEGVGTVFRVILPALGEGHTIEENNISRTFSGKGRVLVMDDEQSIREIAEKLLNKLGYDVDIAKDGEEAIIKYKLAKESNKPIDVIIMDLTIPGGMGGKKAIKKILEIDAKAKAVVSSGYTTDPIITDYKQHGFQGYVVKPYKIEELSKVLYNVINSEEPL